MSSAEQIIEMFGMEPLAGEGGYYVETYRCDGQIARAHLPAGYGGDRSFGSAILYLLTPEAFSRMHRVRSDEVFHFYLGDPVTMLQLHADGSSEVVTLGQDISGGQRVQAVVPGGSWQGCVLDAGGDFALMGTTVSPGFEFSDFEVGERELLVGRYAGQEELIVRLTAGGG